MTSVISPPDNHTTSDESVTPKDEVPPTPDTQFCSTPPAPAIALLGGNHGQLPPTTKPDYGIDAPAVMRNLFLFGALCLLVASSHRPSHIGPVDLQAPGMFRGRRLSHREGFLFLLYVKSASSAIATSCSPAHLARRRAGPRRRLRPRPSARRSSKTHLNGTGHATGIDIWSNVDMGGNSAAATQHNLDLEGVADRCTLVSGGAQEMPSRRHLRRHRLQSLPPQHLRRPHPPPGPPPDRPRPQARRHRPHLRLQTHRRIRQRIPQAGLEVEKKRGSIITTFPPLTVVIARKPVT
jgi:arsenite methyltransferase